ncbi:uncharacterized protein LOC127869883 [Dreissena polymorpha]|uniref:uncharacterized protein LOC127869883 n=1 Tax=Dreissena polymorpha TaxID=45954 RepID=UPI00226518C9|nr:uncharacterized protein LOC127869883 [Dreissena polymorpha]
MTADYLHSFPVNRSVSAVLFRLHTSKFTTVLSDNATTFKAAARHLHNLIQSPLIQRNFSNMGITWKFIPTKALWYGGWWKRLIGVTNSAVKKILGRSFVTLKELQTIIVEIEAIINDRPLTYVSEDINDTESISPSFLTYGRRLT